MMTVRTATAVAALLGSTLFLPSASEAQYGALSGIPGYLDPSTGTFTARADLEPNAAAKEVSGTIIVKTTVFLDQTIPATTQITCSVSLGTSDAVADNSASGSNQAVRTGSKATCTTRITFLWEIDPTVTKKMRVGVGVSTATFGKDQFRSASTSVSVLLTAKTKSFTLAM